MKTDVRVCMCAYVCSVHMHMYVRGRGPAQCHLLHALMCPIPHHRHKLKRLNTPDITFNNIVMPRPCTDMDGENLTVSDILQCFNPDGTPLESLQLSPIPAVSNMHILSLSVTIEHCPHHVLLQMSNMDKLCLWTFPEEGEFTHRSL